MMDLWLACQQLLRKQAHPYIQLLCLSRRQELAHGEQRVPHALSRSPPTGEVFADDVLPVEMIRQCGRSLQDSLPMLFLF